jgi:hypothetical protein
MPTTRLMSEVKKTLFRTTKNACLTGQQTLKTFNAFYKAEYKADQSLW